MKRRGRDRDSPGSTGDTKVGGQKSTSDSRRAPQSDQTLADADQSSADADQTHSDADQIASTDDQQSAATDEGASARDQAVADRFHAAHSEASAEDERDYQASRRDRAVDSMQRQGSRIRRARAAGDRDATAKGRDRIADDRDAGARARDIQTADLAEWTPRSDAAALIKQLEELGARAAADRARAATDRARAARDRASAARERSRLEAALRSAHLDELTGAYRREMGQLALSHEIDRARRTDGRFVLAFVDVDGLKDVNDRDGHAVGDRVLQSVVREIRARLRTFDPIFRYGGDEFVCGLSGTNLVEAERRFESIAAAIQSDTGAGISVGFAALTDGDTVDQLTERADAAMREVKTQHHRR
jgi:diguanylate cyclase (GGDEF)-like protein